MEVWCRGRTSDPVCWSCVGNACHPPKNESACQPDQLLVGLRGLSPGRGGHERLGGPVVAGCGKVPLFAAHDLGPVTAQVDGPADCRRPSMQQYCRWRTGRFSSALPERLATLPSATAGVPARLHRSRKPCHSASRPLEGGKVDPLLQRRPGPPVPGQAIARCWTFRVFKEGTCWNRCRYCRGEMPVDRLKRRLNAAGSV
jgi:hypothetical protein